jgi:hypothetical protein
MKKARIVVLGLFLASALNSFAIKQNQHCQPDPDAGALMCGQQCRTFDSCESTATTPSTAYCWLAYTVSGTYVIACHEGEYDPCCDPNYQW